MISIIRKKRISLSLVVVAVLLSVFMMSMPVSAATYVSTDKQTYQKGESIVIKGTSDTYPPGSHYKLEVIKGDPYLGEYVTETYAYLDSNGELKATVNTNQSWNKGDDYIVVIRFGPTGKLLNVTNEFSVK